MELVENTDFSNRHWELKTRGKKTSHVLLLKLYEKSEGDRNSYLDKNLEHVELFLIASKKRFLWF